jgi:Na+/H+-dicarboxylate symporter
VKTPKGHLLYIVLGAVLGGWVGAVYPELGVQSGVLGEVFLNALKMMVLPLVITSVIVGITNLQDSKTLGAMGTKTLAYYFMTTGIAVLIGIAVVNWIKPGVGYEVFTGNLPESVLEKGGISVKDILVSMIHPNLVQAAADFRILPLIVASIIFGVALLGMKESGKPVVDFVTSLNELVMRIVIAVIWFTPIGIFGLIAHRVGITGGGQALVDLLSSLGKYCTAVVAGLLIHALIVLPLLLIVFAKRNPVTYFFSMAKALMMAFATASSSATLPVTLKSAQEAGVSKRTSNVVLPLGATINMDGTALYEAVAAIFIAQSYGIGLGWSEQLIIVLTATLASIGAAGIPEAGLVTLILVLESVGLPIEGIGIILAVDWALDRCRTTVNVWGDAIGAAVIDKTNAEAIGPGPVSASDRVRLGD